MDFHISGIKIFGGDLTLHWTALAAAVGILLVTMRNPVSAVFAICCYLSVILLHETGHAFVASRAGCDVLEIRLGAIHGQCIYADPYDQWTVSAVAWGGVLAQLLVAIPLIVIDIILDNPASVVWRPVAGILGYLSLIFALMNLLPVMNLDGNEAWKIVPLWLRRRRGRRKSREVIERLRKR